MSTNRIMLGIKVFISMIFIFSSVSLSFGQPAINLTDEPGVFASKSAPDGTELGFYVEIKDWDGISTVGSSHEVTVILPDQTVIPLTFDYWEDNSTAYYEGGYQVSPVDGSYLFSVTNNQTAQSGKLSEELVVSSQLEAPDPNSFSPPHGSILSSTTPTISWSSVNGAYYYRVKVKKYDDSVSWKLHTGSTSITIPPGMLEPNTRYKYNIDARGEHRSLDVDNTAKTRNMSAPEHYEFAFTTGAETEDPFINVEPYGVYTFQDRSAATPFVRFNIKVSDAQGVPENIKSVTVTFPGGGEPHDLYFDENENPTTGIYRNDYFPPYQNGSFDALQSGIYTFYVEDKNGYIFTETEELTVNDIGFVPIGSMSPSHNEVLNTTAVTFSWDPVPGAADYTIRLADEDYSSLNSIETEQTSYSLPPGILKDNSLYRYMIETNREYRDENVDNQSTLIPGKWMYHQFITTPVVGGSNEPVIESGGGGVYTQNIPHGGTDESIYGLCFYVHVTDQDGVPGNIKKVEVILPDATRREIMYDSGPNTSEGYYEYCETLDFYSPDQPEDIWPGTYTFVVTDHDDNTSSFTDDLVVNTMPFVVPYAPLHNATVYTTSPTFVWPSVPGAQYYKVRIHGSWDGSVFASEYLSSDTTSYTVPTGKLSTGNTYSYATYAYDALLPTGDVDNLSKYKGRTADLFRFTVEAGAGDGSVPTLPGNDVVVQPVDMDTGLAPATITFETITGGGGTTSVTMQEQGPPPPSGFKFGDPPIYSDLTTTASYTGTIEVCISYMGVNLEDERTVTLFHFEDTNSDAIADTWIDITTRRDLNNKYVCGEVQSFSMFAVFEAEDSGTGSTSGGGGGGGCFIATAAYGAYNAPMVQPLREFRDEYLLTNKTGQTFVNAYYLYSPPAAQWLEQHGWVKPIVQALLIPLVVLAWFLVKLSLLVQVLAIILLVGLIGSTVRVRRRKQATS